MPNSEAPALDEHENIISQDVSTRALYQRGTDSDTNLVEQLLPGAIVATDYPIEDTAPRETTQQKMESRAIYHEIAPNRVLVRINHGDLSHGQIIPIEAWTKLYGAELMKVWEQILTEPGDEIIIKGSSIIRLFFGSFVYDTTKQCADFAYGTDVDCWTYQDRVTERIGHIAAKSTATGAQKQKRWAIPLENTRVEFIDTESVRASHLEALFDVYKAIVNLPKDTPRQREYRNSVAETLFGSIEGCANLLTNTNEARVIAADGFFQYESLGLKLRINQKGEIEASVYDPTGFLTEEVSATPNPNEQIRMQQEHGSYFGISLTNNNLLSPYELMCQSLLYIDTQAATEKIPLYAIRSLARLIRYSTENSIELLADAGLIDMLQGLGLQQSVFVNELKLPDSSAVFRRPNEVYRDLFLLTTRINAGDVMLSFPPEFFEGSGYKNANDWIRYNFQIEFARASHEDPGIALAYMFAYFKLGNLVSPDIAEMFEEYHRKIPPNNMMMTMIRAYDLKMDTLPESLNFPAIRFLVRLNNLCNAKYKSRYVQLESGTREGETHIDYDSWEIEYTALHASYDELENKVRQGLVTETEFRLELETILENKIRLENNIKNNGKMAYEETMNPPTELPEVIALMCAAAGWTFENNQKEISNIIAGWTTENPVTEMWQTSLPETPFSTDLSMERIKFYMDMWKEIDESLVNS